VLQHSASPIASVLSEVLACGQFDLVHCESFALAGIVAAFTGMPKVLSAQNVESQIWERRTANERRVAARVIALTQWKRVLQYEKAVVPRFDAVLAVSQEDAMTLAGRFGARRTILAPNGVDTNFYRPMPGIEGSRDIVFTGAMDWAPNEDGALYFLSQVLPLVRSALPDVRFVIAGRKPSARLVAMTTGRSWVHVTGEVTDIRPWLAAGAVVVVPLRVGGGTRLKILEAMAMGRPVVSTSIGAEGLGLVPGDEIVLADDANSFAAEALRLLRRPDVGAALGRRGRERVVRDFDWRAVLSSVGPLYDDLVGQARSARSRPNPGIISVAQTPQERLGEPPRDSSPKY
jgi:glycosyltransferase involved in cell wall biosynthesis